MQLSNRFAHTLGDTKSIKILGKIKDFVEALTKFINGHGDAQGGAIISNDLETFAVSLGHDESLIFPQPSYDERIHLYPEKFRKGFIRFSVGLEDPDDIIADLDQALRSIGL